MLTQGCLTGKGAVFDATCESGMVQKLPSECPHLDLDFDLNSAFVQMQFNE